MSSNSKSLEKKLDRDFLCYLSLTKKLFDKIVSENDKALCEAWLKKLCGKCITTVSGKRDRNIYLSRLLLQMQDGALKDIFLSPPPAANLQSPYTVFGLPKQVEDLKGFEEMGFQLDSDATGGSGDFSEVSRDGRTYLATREIKNGMMAYLAVTITEDEPLWLPQQVRYNFPFSKWKDKEMLSSLSALFRKWIEGNKDNSSCSYHSSVTTTVELNS